MKTKNIFRVFLTAIFVLGAMAMNAQTKVYVHQAGGISDEYNIADLDSISFNPVSVPEVPPGENMLVNPGFEDPDDETIVIAGVAPWQAMTQDEMLLDAASAPSPQTANRVSPTDVFWTNNPTCTAVHGGKYAGRLQASSSAGLYQLVNVTPGKTYQFKAYVLHFKTNATNQGVKTEYLRIKSADGAVELTNVAIGTEENTWMEVSGSVTIPSDYTMSHIRFQISHHDGTAAPNRTPASLVDDWEFYEVQ